VHLDRKRLFAFVVGDAQAVLLHLLDMRRPEIDEGHILAGARHMRPGIAAHRAHAAHRDPFAHNSSLHMPQAPAGRLTPILAPDPDRCERAVFKANFFVGSPDRRSAIKSAAAREFRYRSAAKGTEFRCRPHGAIVSKGLISSVFLAPRGLFWAAKYIFPLSAGEMGPCCRPRNEA